MKTISANDVGACITEALETQKKNILFVSLTLDNRGVDEWFENNKAENEKNTKNAE